MEVLIIALALLREIKLNINFNCEVVSFNFALN